MISALLRRRPRRGDGDGAVTASGGASRDDAVTGSGAAEDRRVDNRVAMRALAVWAELPATQDEWPVGEFERLFTRLRD